MMGLALNMAVLNIAVDTQNSIYQVELIISRRVLHIEIVTVCDKHRPCLF
jgi:hypothetical protein